MSAEAPAVRWGVLDGLGSSRIDDGFGMWVRVLGSAAGGGFPQWNCTCPPCRAVRDGSRPCRPRTQSSIAVSPDYRRWFLFNASPDIHAQIESFPALHPSRGPGGEREVPAAGRAAHRRGARPHAWPAAAAGGTCPGVHATEAVHETRCGTGRRCCGRSSAYCPVELACRSCPVPTCRWRRAVLPGLRRAHHEAGPVRPGRDAKAGSSATACTDERSGRALVYLPWSAGPDRRGARAARGLRLPAGRRHLLAGRRADPARPGGQDGARDGAPADRRSGRQPRASWPPLPIERKIYIHINNTNPILLEDSPERRVIEQHGMEVAVDGLELSRS